MPCPTIEKRFVYAKCVEVIHDETKRTTHNDKPNSLLRKKPAHGTPQKRFVGHLHVNVVSIATVASGSSKRKGELNTQIFNRKIQDHLRSASQIRDRIWVFSLLHIGYYQKWPPEQHHIGPNQTNKSQL